MMCTFVPLIACGAILRAINDQSEGLSIATSNRWGGRLLCIYTVAGEKEARVFFCITLTNVDIVS